MSPRQSDDPPSAKHRAPGGRSNSILHYALAALCLGAAIALLAGGYLYISYLMKPVDLGTVLPVPQESFAPALPTMTTEPPKDDKGCSDFFDREDAQKYFEAQGGPSRDPDKLDLDKDGRACENYVYNPSSSPAMTSSKESHDNS